MFEKSKSAISFSEFQKKINIVNNFENDWGHFYDHDEPDDNNSNNNYVFQNNLFQHKVKKIKTIVDIENKKPENIEAENIENIEAENKKAENIEKNNNYNEDNTRIYVIETIFTAIKISAIILLNYYFIYYVI